MQTNFRPTAKATRVVGPPSDHCIFPSSSAIWKKKLMLSSPCLFQRSDLEANGNSERNSHLKVQIIPSKDHSLGPEWKG
ncbi:hypothetical protein O181_024771 [Austropuccinia psidii MF-1]|uniref:Uncharacterized protein n=1 Tax=Austropuccinia psidii MF-1 TaxID=1389203 RepID=A0A9Q3CHB6_9BASI|nr:hypothetical protein [Austropuccinia psidii MF-1]